MRALASAPSHCAPATLANREFVVAQNRAKHRAAFYLVPAGHEAETHLDSIFMVNFISRPPTFVIVVPDPVTCSGLSA